MLISDKQHRANQQNAQHSSGPKSEAGKAAIRFNALTFGLRTRATIIPGENAAAYSQLWDEMESNWQPQDRTEMCELETIVTSQWMLIRAANSEAQIYERIAFGAEQLSMLLQVSKLRAQLERSYRTAVRDLQDLQKNRQSRPTAQPAQPVIPSRLGDVMVPHAAPTPVPPPAYARTEAAAAAQPVSCAPGTPDSR